MAELKPCPFCGDEAIYITTAIKAGPTVKEFYSISCLGCNAEIYKYYKTEEEAIESWNRRTPEIVKVETSFYDKEEIHENCTVQVLTNTATGEASVGWWKNGK